MPLQGNVRTLYEDTNHTTAIWPRTSITAVVDSEGRTVSTLIAGKQDAIADLTDIRTKANSALQDGDNISGLTNDSGYVTATYHDSTKQNVIQASEVQVDTTGWVEDTTNNVFYKDITVSGMSANESPWIDIKLSGNKASMDAQILEYKKILTIYTLTNALRVVASSAITTAITLTMKR